MVVEEMVANPDCSVVCIREIQKSLKLSAMKLIVAKIKEFGVEHLFQVLSSEIRRVGGAGLCIFIGMQEHTADTVKSLEGFDIAWIEEAQSLSQRSLALLRPTIRKEGSQIWASWNPRRRGDPIERLLRGSKGAREDAIVVRANYTDNPFLPETMRLEAEDAKELDPDGYGHTWLGEYENIGAKVVIPSAWVQSSFGLAEDLGLEVTGKRYAGLDVAGGEEGGDENALAIRHGFQLESVDTWNGLDTSLTTNKAAMTCKRANVPECFYDSVSIGEGVTGEWAAMGRRNDQPEGVVLLPWNGGGSVLNPDEPIEPDNKQSPLNKDQYQNLKAQGWFALRKRFENAHKARLGKPFDAEMLISIPKDIEGREQIEIELTQPQHKTSGTGKTMVDKQPDDAPSPNVADAIMQAYWPVIEEKPVVAIGIPKRHR